ncbi:MAG: pimeloyl-ACP methyl ester carboxylesterase [Candidatus Azotimanducaceae bacterium]
MNLTLASGIEIEFETYGADSQPAILLIRGLGTQLIDWPFSLIKELRDEGFRIVVFDNRDAGLSRKFQGAPDPYRVAKGLETAPYTLSDMALDVVQLMDGLHIDRAHVFAISLGGMIGQVLAAQHPDRLLSLFSVMSSSSRRGLPGATNEAARTLEVETDSNADRESIIAAMINVLEVCGSPGYPMSKDELRGIAQRRYDRDHDPLAGTRQMAAVAATGDRSSLLQSIQIPTCVIHGEEDPLIPMAAGVDTCEQIPGAVFHGVPGMGHDIPAGLVNHIVALVVTFISDLDRGAFPDE